MWASTYVLTDIATSAAQEKPYFLCDTRAVVQVMYLEDQAAEQLGKLWRKINIVVFLDLMKTLIAIFWRAKV
jgi:hypothetical protein